jgi:hypothetical protein
MVDKNFSQWLQPVADLFPASETATRELALEGQNTGIIFLLFLIVGIIFVGALYLYKRYLIDW